jgi:hypothetical protein
MNFQFLLFIQCTRRVACEEGSITCLEAPVTSRQGKDALLQKTSRYEKSKEEWKEVSGEIEKFMWP